MTTYSFDTLPKPGASDHNWSAVYNQYLNTGDVNGYAQWLQNSKPTVWSQFTGSPGGTGGTGSTGGTQYPTTTTYPSFANYTPYRGNYDTYGQGPEWNFFGPQVPGSVPVTPGSGTPGPGGGGIGGGGTPGPGGGTPGTGGGGIAGGWHGGNDRGGYSGGGGGGTGAGNGSGLGGLFSRGYSSTTDPGTGQSSYNPDTGGYIDIGPYAGGLMSAAGTLLPGPYSYPFSLANTAMRAVNTYQTDQNRDVLGLPGLGIGQVVGGVLGMNNYGNFSGNATVANPEQTGGWLNGLNAAAAARSPLAPQWDQGLTGPVGITSQGQPYSGFSMFGWSPFGVDPAMSYQDAKNLKGLQTDDEYNQDFRNTLSLLGELSKGGGGNGSGSSALHNDRGGTSYDSGTHNTNAPGTSSNAQGAEGIRGIGAGSYSDGGGNDGGGGNNGGGSQSGGGNATAGGWGGEKEFQGGMVGDYRKGGMVKRRRLPRAHAGIGLPHMGPVHLPVAPPELPTVPQMPPGMPAGGPPGMAPMPGPSAGPPMGGGIAAGIGAAGGGMMPAGGAAPMSTGGGPVDSPTPGRADNLTTSVPAGTYIVPSDVVSAMGQGNTAAGYQALDHFSKSVRPIRKARGNPTAVRLSGGEYRIHPHIVAGIGRGSLQKGADHLDRMVAAVRDQHVKNMKKMPKPYR